MRASPSACSPSCWPRSTEPCHAAQRLWRDLVQACGRAAEDGLSTDELGYITIELGLALLALDFTKEELVTYVGNLHRELSGDGLAAVNAAFRMQGQSAEASSSAWSWVGSLSKLSKTHPLWAERQFGELEPLLAFAPTRLLHHGDDGAA